MLMKFFGVLLAGFVLLMVASIAQGGDDNDWTEENPPKPETILAVVKKQGPRRVISEFWRDSRWGYVMDQIAMGKEIWLKVALALRPGTDAGGSTYLKIAVGRALAHEPSRVLEMQDKATPEFDIGYICGANVDGEANSFEEAMGNNKKRMKSVSKVNNPRLIPIRDTCLKQLREAQKHLRRYYGEE